MSKNEIKEIDLENPYSNESINKIFQNNNYDYNDLWKNPSPVIPNNLINIPNNNIINSILGSVQKDTIINDNKKVINPKKYSIENFSINIDPKVKKQKNKNNNNNINMINCKINISNNFNPNLISNYNIPIQVHNSILENRPNPFYVKDQSFQNLSKYPHKEINEEKSQEKKIKEDLNPKVKVIKKRPRIYQQKLIGNISYLNSVIQLICNLTLFVNNFLNRQNENDLKGNNCLLSVAIYQICNNICNYNNKNERDKCNYELLEILGKYNIAYKDNQEKNPNDLILLILEKLHEELSNFKNQNNNNSIISDYFSWNEIKQITCYQCLNQNSCNRNFNAFELNLIETAQWKNNPNINLKDCLDFYETSKEKINFCNKCYGYNKCSIVSKIFSSPKYFIFLLDIGQNSNIKLILEQEINLKSKKFELSGIVFYNTIKNNYNVLYISRLDQKWYLFNDESLLLYNINDFINAYNYANNFYKLSILVYSFKDLI